MPRHAMRGKEVLAAAKYVPACPCCGALSKSPECVAASTLPKEGIEDGARQMPERPKTSWILSQAVAGARKKRDRTSLTRPKGLLIIVIRREKEMKRGRGDGAGKSKAGLSVRRPWSIHLGGSLGKDKNSSNRTQKGTRRLEKERGRKKTTFQNTPSVIPHALNKRGGVPPSDDSTHGKERKERILKKKGGKNGHVRLDPAASTAQVAQKAT